MVKGLRARILCDLQSVARARVPRSVREACSHSAGSCWSLSVGVSILDASNKLIICREETNHLTLYICRIVVASDRISVSELDRIYIYSMPFARMVSSARSWLYPRGINVDK